MAGFFDTLFGGGAEAEAADKNRALYNLYQQQGTGFLQNGLNQSANVLQNNQTTGLQALRDNQAAGTAALLGGQAGALSSLDAAGGYYAPLAAKYGSATSLGLDALGVNGTAGNSRASAAFTNSPGYSAGIDAGIDVLNRRRAAAGMLNSGNADLDALTFGQNSQNQQYNTWLTNLLGQASPELAAVGGMASAANNKANVYQNTGQNIANLGNTTTAGIVGLGNTTAGGLSNLYQQNASDNVSLLGNTTSGNANANTLQAQGEAAGAKNLLGAGLSLATIAAGGGLGGSLGGLGSAFMGGGSPTGYGNGGLLSWLKK